MYYFSCTLTCPDEDQNSLSVKCKVDLSRLFLEKGKNAHAGTPVSSGQRESFFQSRDENESFSDSISFIETRPRIPDTYSQALRRDREKISSNLRHRDEIEIYYLHSQALRREREFPWSDLVFRDETENSETCHLSLKSGLNGLTILNAIFGRLTILNAGPHILLDVLPF